jgi:hypothetical protein
LIAKHGDEREWHFAHEAGQERPECEAGALNLFRRLAIEHLRAQPELELTPYQAQVAESSSTARHVEDVAWNARFAEPLRWLPSGPKNAAVASGRLDNGVEAQLLVDVGADRPTPPVTQQRQIAAVMFWCAAPPENVLRERSSVERHIALHGRFTWIHHPDVFGLVEAARMRVHERVIADERAAAALRARWAEEEERSRKRMAEEASRRWAGISKRLHDAPRTENASAPRTDRPTTAEPVRAQAHPAIAAETPEPVWPWAPERKPKTAFIFYRLKTGDAWVIYTMTDGNLAVVPWPKPEEGWDEALPSSVGVPDAGLTIYRVRDMSSAMVFFSSRAVTVRATSNPREFEHL